jgi:regulator of sigma E protease
MLSILGAILAIGLLIVVHEAGHYFVARRCRMRVDRFSIGFGPPLLRWRRRETDFTLGPIPFGGFVQIRGMNLGEETDLDDPTAYPNRPVWQRFLTIFAGPGTNYLFAIFLALALYAIAGRPSGTEWWQIGEVEAGWSAAGVLEPGDRIVKLEGKPYYARHGSDPYPSLLQVFADRPGEAVAMTVLRDGREVDVAVKSALDPAYLAGTLFADIPAPLRPPRYRIGVKLAIVEAPREPMSVGEVIVAAARYPVDQTRLIAVGLWEIATRQQEAVFLGPVGITGMIKKTIDIGWVRVLELLMLLNVYLGLFNLLPLPALDGGRLVFLGYEMATRRRANPKIEAAVHMVGIMALLLLMVLVTYKDIARLF